MAFSPRKRAKSERPRIHSWKETKEVKLLGFAGYKAGMTRVIAIDNRKHKSTSSLELSLPVTIIDVPPMKVVGIRVYAAGYNGLITYKDISPEKAKELDGLKDMDQVSDVMAVAATQPKLIATPKKKSDVMEIAIGGTIEEKLEYAKSILGKEFQASEVFEENQQIDVTAVTCGKGFQGVVKRWGVKIQPRKSGKGTRHVGSGGPWKPTHKIRDEPLPGQMGYHTRTEYNKTILKFGGDGKDVTPAGGFLNYGPVKGNYVIISGSVPGPAKRVIRLTSARRSQQGENFEITRVNLKSHQGAR